MSLKIPKIATVTAVFVAVFAFAVALTFLQPSDVSALTAEQQRDAICEGAGGCGNDGTTLPETIRNVANILIYIVGAISVIMMIIGGVRYALSHGDSSATKGAKDTILYALIGVVVAFSAYAIVNFVIDNI